MDRIPKNTPNSRAVETRSTPRIAAARNVISGTVAIVMDKTPGERRDAA
jgi:hypothetical protein